MSSNTLVSSFSSYPASRDSRDREQELINAFEADQERITLTLSRKLEKLRNEKIQLENTLEAENESHVLRLSRQLSVLRSQQEQLERGESAAGPSTAPPPLPPPQAPPGWDPRYPSTQTILDALRRENESLRTRLSDAERNYGRIVRLNDVYREELIELRRRLGMSVDSLIGLSAASIVASPAESFSQPSHLRQEHFNLSSEPSSPEFNTHDLPNRATGATPIPRASTLLTITSSSTINSGGTIASVTSTPGVPIPRRTTPHARHPAPLSTTSSSSATTTASSSISSSPTSPFLSSSPSPFPHSPNTGLMHNPRHHHHHHYTNSQESSVPASSYQTQMTTPPSSTSPLHQLDNVNLAAHLAFQPLQQLSYPSVPPPSLASSLASPMISRRPSVSQPQSSAPGNTSTSARGRRTSIDRGARIAETGSLLNRRGSMSGAGSNTMGTLGGVGALGLRSTDPLLEEEAIIE